MAFPCDGVTAKENADQIAQAEVALQLKELQLEKARSEDPAEQVAAAQAQVRQLELQIAQARVQDAAPDVTAARVELERAQIALNETQDEYGKALDRPWEEQKVRDAWAKQLKQAELNYSLAQASLDRARNARAAVHPGSPPRVRTTTPTDAPRVAQIRPKEGRETLV